jgi:hypothetical protein
MTDLELRAQIDELFLLQRVAKRSRPKTNP